jgi:hypothetical protein
VPRSFSRTPVVAKFEVERVVRRLRPTRGPPAGARPLGAAFRWCGCVIENHAERIVTLGLAAFHGRRTRALEGLPTTHAHDSFTKSRVIRIVSSAKDHPIGLCDPDRLVLQPCDLDYLLSIL